MPKEITYLKRKGKYLVVKDDGTSEILNSEKELDKYIKDNNMVVKR